MRHAFVKSLLLALAFTLPAQAETGCALRLVDGQAHVAELSCRNILAGSPDVTHQALIDGGLSVGVTILHGPGEVPDRFQVVVPEGFLAVPAEVDVEENTGTTVLVYEWVGT